MRSRILIICFIVLLTTVPAVGAAGDEAPSWLKEAAAIQVPTYEKDVPAVVLRKEQTVQVGNDGKITTATFFAIRILTREGRDFARATELYLTKAARFAR